MRKLILILAYLATSSVASATTITLEFPGNETPTTKQANYDCGDSTIAATYINTSQNQLAVLELGDKVIVTVVVMSGSGARYVGQQYEWWTKGDDATLSDMTKDPQLQLTCALKE